MDEKGASTFPFHNLPPEPKKTSQRSFLCFLTFPQDKIKSRWRLLLNRNICEHKCKIPSQFSHRITEPATLLGTNFLKVGLPQGFRSPLHTCFDCLDCFTFWVLVWVCCKSYTRIWGTFLGKQQKNCEGTVRGIPTWLKQSATLMWHFGVYR